MSLPTGWTNISLAEAGQWGSGGTPKANERSFYDGDIPWIRSGDLPDGPIIKHEAHISSRGLENSSAKWVDANAVLIAMYGATIGKLGLTTYPVTTNQAIAFLKPAIGIEPRFIFQYFRARKAEFVALGQGGAQPNISQEIIKSQELALPPTAEQRRIVAKLDELTARIARARAELDRMRALAKRLRAGTVRKAFSGRLTSDWRSENLVSDSSYDANEKLPHGWTWRALGELTDIKSGLTLGKRRADNAVLIETPYLRVANVQRGRLDLELIKEVSVTPAEIEALRLLKGDVLLNEGGDRDKLGRGWVWEGQVDPCIHQNHVFRARLRDSRNSPYYISHYANEFGQDYFLEHGTQTTNLASISKSKVSALPVPVAPFDEQALIVSRIEAAFARADRLEAEAARARKLLDRLESAILAKAFRGELVPQDPNDEPVSVLLERITKQRAAARKLPARRSTRDKSMNRDAKKVLLVDSENWPVEGLAFDNIMAKTALPYEEIRAAMFELLGEKKPKLRQVFDVDAECMLIQRVAQ